MKRLGPVFLFCICVLATVFPLGAQESQTITTPGGLTVTVPDGFTATNNDNLTVTLTRESDLLIVFLFVNEDILLFPLEDVPEDAATAMNAFFETAGSIFGISPSDVEPFSLENVSGELLVQEESGYGERQLSMFVDLPDGSLGYAIAVQADADVDQQRKTLLDIVDSMTYHAPVPPYTPPETVTLAVADMPAGTILFNDGSTFTYPDSWSPFVPDIPVSNSVTLATDDMQTFMTAYVVESGPLEERFARELNIEPVIQRSGLTDYEAEDMNAVVYEDEERRIYEFVSQPWTLSVQPQINFFYLVVAEVNSVSYLAAFQAETRDVENIESLQAEVLEIAQSLIFGTAH